MELVNEVSLSISTGVATSQQHLQVYSTSSCYYLWTQQGWLCNRARNRPIFCIGTQCQNTRTRRVIHQTLRQASIGLIPQELAILRYHKSPSFQIHFILFRTVRLLFYPKPSTFIIRAHHRMEKMRAFSHLIVSHCVECYCLSETSLYFCSHLHICTSLLYLRDLSFCCSLCVILYLFQWHFNF